MKFDLASTLGAAFIGFAVAAVFYGVTCTQTFVYFRTNARHEPALKTLVLLCWALDTAHMVFIGHAMYHHLIENFANPFSNLRTIWSMTAIVYVAAPLEFFVRSVFIARFWKLSGRNRPATAFLGLLNLAVLGAGLYFGWKTSHLKMYTEIVDLEWVICTALAMHLSIDICITAFIAFILWRSLTGFGATDDMIRAILKFVINAGLMSSIMSLVLLITYFTAPYSFVYISFYFLFCEVLLNSLLASLNLRESLREQTLSTPQSFPPTSPRGPNSPYRSSYPGSAGAAALGKARGATLGTPLTPAKLSPPPKRGKVSRMKELVRLRREGKRESEQALTVRVETSTLQMVSSSGSVSLMEMSPISGTESGKHEIGYAV